jgi:hypothetical protein
VWLGDGWMHLVRVLVMNDPVVFGGFCGGILSLVLNLGFALSSLILVLLPRQQSKGKERKGKERESLGCGSRG